ncbi:hypothetical protein V6N13_088591 [Hibiscus sabdariffa]
MEVLISIAAKAVEYTVDPIAQQISYLFKHNSNFHNLKEQIEKLQHARGRVQHSVDEERRNAKEIEADVLKWLASVDNKLTENAGEKLEQDEEKTKNKCTGLAFPVLETMHLNFLTNLEKICHGELKTGSFSQLTIIQVGRCGRLKNLLSFSVAKNLNQLQQISVWLCENITEIVAGERREDNEENDILEFRRLCSLTLRDFPKFKSFYLQEKTGSSSSGQGESASNNISYRGSDGIHHSLFNSKVSFPGLKELNLELVSGIERIWHDDQLSIMSLGVQSLTSLTLFRCHKLKYAFTSSMVRSFVQLRTLVVIECDEMQDIIEERISSNIKLFPKLDSLKLSELPNLKRFCCGTNTIEFPSLTKLEVEICPVLKTFYYDGSSVGDNISLDHNLYAPLFDEKVILPVLEELSIYKVDNLERLWPNQLAQHSFSKLTSLYLQGSERTGEIIQGGDGEISFPQLNLLELRGLQKLESFCSSKNYTFGFPSLQNVTVAYCPKLKMFTQGDSTTPVLHKVTFATWENYEEHSEDPFNSFRYEEMWENYRERWVGSLNNTIQHIFSEQNAIREEFENLEQYYISSIKDEGNSSSSNTQSPGPDTETQEFFFGTKN